jgi:predicted MFS family arabinose efflux permease
MLTAAKMTDQKQKALRFVLLVGAMSLFADFTYEGARGIAGPFLALLGASGAAVGIASGLGELAGYGLRLVSGRIADRTQKFWPISILGYLVQMLAVPALALAGNWPVAVGLLVLERVGKAIRKPPTSVMLSHAGAEMGGYGWAFGLHEALDQTGALLGPLAMALVLAKRHDYRLAFATLGLSALATLGLLAVARVLYPRPEDFERSTPEVDEATGFSREFWLYLAGTALTGAGFADFPLIAFHFQKASILSPTLVPVFYAVSMGVGGLGALLFGAWFDRKGVGLLIPVTALASLYAPLCFLGGLWPALAGVMLWGLALGAHESIMAAAVARMVGKARRASAYGLFTALYGLGWFLGSALLGFLYDHSLGGVIFAAVALQLLAIPFFWAASRLGGRATT